MCKRTHCACKLCNQVVQPNQMATRQAAHSQPEPGDNEGMTDTTFSNDLAPKDWTARWAISLTTPLYSLRMRNEIDKEMRAFARRMPEYHSVVMAGLLADVIATFAPEDPFRNLYRDDDDVIRLPGGEAFGSWHNATDLMPASNADVGQDHSLAPLAEVLSDESVEFFYRAAESWESAREYLLTLSLDKKLKQSTFEIAEDAMRWALLRRQAYALDGDGFFATTAVAWGARTSKIVAGEPFDESRWIRLRSGASVPPGTYEELTGPEKSVIKHPSDQVGGEEEASEAP